MPITMTLIVVLYFEKINKVLRILWLMKFMNAK